METLIVRNPKVRSLFDVVQVNFETEEVNYIAQMLSFEQAQMTLKDMGSEIVGNEEEIAESNV